MENNQYFKSVLKGTIGSMILCLIGVTALSGLMTKIIFSEELSNMLYVIISLVSLSLGAIIGAKKNETKGWLVGFGVAIGYYLVLFLLTAIVSGSLSFSLFQLTKLGIAMLVGTLAGMLGINL